MKYIPENNKCLLEQKTDVFKSLIMQNDNCTSLKQSSYQIQFSHENGGNYFCFWGIHKLRWEALGVRGLHKWQRYYISLFCKLVKEGGEGHQKFSKFCERNLWAALFKRMRDKWLYNSQQHVLNFKFL